MPEGWRLAFGEQLCQEIQEALEEAQKLDPNGGYEECAITTNYDSKVIVPYIEGYRITEIKEKYGTLRWYDNGATQKVHDIIAKYERLSGDVCIRCGKPAIWESLGWISFFCDDCAKTEASEVLKDYPDAKFESQFTRIEK